jgi:hypothetical protein
LPLQLRAFRVLRNESEFLRFGDFVLLVVQFLAGFDDDAVIDFPFEVFQAVVFLVVEKVGDVRVQTDDDVLAAIDARMLACADDTNSVTETDETNTCVASTTGDYDLVSTATRATWRLVESLTFSSPKSRH